MGIAVIRSVDMRNIELRRAWRQKFFSGFTGIDPLRSTERDWSDRRYAHKRQQAREWLTTQAR